MTDFMNRGFSAQVLAHPRATASLALAPLIAIATGFAAPSEGFAQPVIAQAQSLFDQGQDLLKAGKITEACAAFDASHRLDPVVTTLLNLADCRAKNGQLASAWGHFLEAERTARVAGNDKLARVAAKHAAKLKPRLSQLVIVVPDDRQVPGLLLFRGSEPIAPATWNHALPVDGGPYHLTAKAPGQQPWTTTIHIKAEGDVQTIEVPSFHVDKRIPQVGSPNELQTTAEPARTPASPTSQVTARSTSKPALGKEPPAEPASSTNKPPDFADDVQQANRVVAPSSDTQRRSLALPLALGAGSLAFTAGAIAFKVSGDAFYDRAKAADTQEARDSAYDSANTRRRVALGLGGAAVVCAGTAIYFYVRQRGETRAAATTWAPVVSPQQAGVALVGSW